MASVAVCPHCYLQLAIPDGTGDDARLECPTCHQEFDLIQTVLRGIPEALPVERTNVANAQTVAEIAAGELEYAATENAEPAVSAFRAEEEIGRAKTVPRATTLADLMADDVAAENAETPGPSFDLPNVPLKRETGGTVEFDSVSNFGASSNTEFELDGVDFENSADDPRATVPDVPFANEPEYATTAAAEAPIQAEPQYFDPSIISSPAPRRRRRSALRTLVGAVLGGFLGLAAGYALLMYLLGPRGDFLQVAQYVPPALLPQSFAADSTATPIRDEMRALPPIEETPADSQPAPTVLHAEEDTSTNMPASYVEQAATPLPEDGALDQALPAPDATIATDAQEPPQFADEPAELLANEPPSAPLPLPISGPTLTAGELAAALATAETAKAGLVAGDLSDANYRRTKGLSYAKFCDLAHALVFAQLSPDVPSDIELHSRASKLFESVLAEANTRDEVARIAPIWIESSHRRHGGVFLAGSLSGGEIAGDVYEYQLETSDGTRHTILATQPLEAASEAAELPWAVIGIIIDRPTQDVAGYTGTAERAIFASQALPLQ